MKALVLAAGRSTRIASRAGDLPKPLITVNGETILLRILTWLSRFQINPIWINLHYKPDLIRQAVRKFKLGRTDVRFSYEPHILGTAGAVRNLQEEWTNPFVVVYGDNLLNFDIDDLLAHHVASSAIVTMALFNWNYDLHSGIAGGRVSVDTDMRITGFFEGSFTQDIISSWVNAGVYVFDPNILDYIADNKLCDFGVSVFPKLLASGGQINGYPIRSYCLAADTPAALDITESQLRKREALH